MNLEPMWEALEQYQQYAEKRGFGAAWKRMTTERTADAAWAAAMAANEALAYTSGMWSAHAVPAAYSAERVVDWTGRGALGARLAASWVDAAITHITRAIEQEQAS